MYIEMSTFAIPAFLLTGLKFAAIIICAWLLVITIGMIIYHMTEK